MNKIRSTIVLREPDERIGIDDDAEWVGFNAQQEPALVLHGPIREGVFDVRSIPWWRVVSIDSNGILAKEKSE